MDALFPRTPPDGSPSSRGPKPPGPRLHCRRAACSAQDGPLPAHPRPPARPARAGTARHPQARPAEHGQARDALEELEAWATNPAAPPFFALLGEYGIGKTTTLKQFTRDLLEKRKSRPELPLPIYVDLRDYVSDAQDNDSVPTTEQFSPASSRATGSCGIAP